MALKFANNAATTLAAGIASGATSITVATGAGALFPTLAAGDHFYATLVDSAQNIEIVKVTARSTDTLTVVRAQEGTSARTYSSGDKIELRLTAAALAEIGAGGGSATLTIDNKTGAYTVVAGDLGKIINCTSGTFTVSLTAAATLGAGFNCWIWNTGSGVVTIDPAGSETIDSVSTLILRGGEGCQVVCDGSNWQTGDKKTMRGYAENGFTTRPVSSGSFSLAMGGLNGVPSVASATYSMAIYGSAASSNSSAIGLNSAGDRATTATGSGAMALGGSYASGTDSFAAAVASNSSAYGARAQNTVAIGLQASAPGSQSVAIGSYTLASAIDSIALREGQAFGYGAIAIGANYAARPTASGAYSIALGADSLAAQAGKIALSGGYSFGSGTVQTAFFILRRATTDATATVLTTTAAAPGTTNQVVLPNDSTYVFRGQLVARNTGNDAESKAWEFKGAIRRGTTAATTALIGTPSIDLIASDGSAWAFTLTADTTNGGLAITVTGEAAKTIRWVCTVQTTEVTG